MAVNATYENDATAINEGSTATLQIKLYDENATQIYSGDITTCVGVLYNEADRTVINSRTAWDLSTDLNASGTYSLDVPLTVLDNIIVKKATMSVDEVHVLSLTVSISDPASTLTEDVRFEVRNRIP